MPSDKSERIKKLIELLKQDASSLHPKFPKMALYTLKDERVVNSIEKRLEKGSNLIDIKALEYNFYTGLNHVFFEFPSTELGLSRDTVLVIVDPNSNVIGVVDPFNPDQPNPLLPPITKLRKTYGEEPFVIARPSATEELNFTEEELAFTRLRSKEFFDKINETSKDRPPDGPCAFGRSTTSCWETCYVVPWDPIPGCAWTQPDCNADACDY
jgi:hypothetical protein